MDELLDSVYSEDYEDDLPTYEATSTVKKESLKERSDFIKHNINKQKRPIRVDKRAMEYYNV